MSPETIQWAVVAAVGVGLVWWLIESIVSNVRSGSWCEVCGYYTESSLHDDDRCEMERKIRTMPGSEIETRKLFRMNRDKLGF